jgi:hypothetical protein
MHGRHLAEISIPKFTSYCSWASYEKCKTMSKESEMYLVRFDAKFLIARKLRLCNTTEKKPLAGFVWGSL